MSGICGFIGTTNSPQQTLTAMCGAIAHRGPDGEGHYVDEGIALGHRFCAHIDPEKGAQPLVRATGAPQSSLFSSTADTFETGDFAITFNGAIYNYQDLRSELVALGYSFSTNSDAEVLLVSYIAWNTKLLEKLRGMFAFAIWDRAQQELFCARDFFGIKPFYYTQTDENFIFASEIKAILEHPAAATRAVNLTALELYLNFQYSVLPETFFKGIFKLAPAHYMIVKPGHAPRIERYGRMTYAIDETISIQEASERIHCAVQNSVAYHKIADVEVASFLSSGVDSNYITASASTLIDQLKTFTVGFATGETEKYNEISYAKQASDYLGIENFSHVITEDEFWGSLETIQWHLDEPAADPAAVALYFTDKEAAKHVKTVLSGEGSDEFFAGYTVYQTPLENKRLSWCPKPLLRGCAALLRALHLRGANYLTRAATAIEEQFIGNANIFTTEERNRLLKHQPSSITPQDITAPYYEEVAHLDDVSKMQHIDLNLWQVGDILCATDKMGMAHGIETRTPFLDEEVWAVARTLPTSCKVSYETSKVALREAAKNLLPPEFCEKRKLGFPVPTRVWLKEEKYYNLVKEAFTSPSAEKYFHTDELVKLLDDHRFGNVDKSRKIWTVYTFLTWHRVYFE
ncbi:MAG: asparagine synthase (glutamine-hydrolyzing) [Eggerthellaceae bacterium]|nr:asparagine synthase (glutamine-hydrolyzing) [Eggerthellaceae bacterium]MDR2721954.1 asparagine synthase (glutamine-hydrolyzing) [Coriobacteriaceae bacterium]